MWILINGNDEKRIIKTFYQGGTEQIGYGFLHFEVLKLAGVYW